MNDHIYWIGTDENLSELLYHNLLYLHARRQPFLTYEEIAATILESWPWGELQQHIQRVMKCRKSRQ